MASAWSLITVTYNSAATLRRYWDDPLPPDVEWIVVDNGSTDDSVRTAEQLGARVVSLGANIGFSAANNRGLALASGDYIAFVNPDVRVGYVDLDGFAQTIDALGGIVGPQLLNDDGSPQPNGRGMPLLAHKILNRTSPAGRDNGYLIFADEGEDKRVFWLIGAAVAGSAATIRRLAGWNERYFLYYEDKDLCIRAWRMGLPVTLTGRHRWTHGWARETKTFRLRPWLREIDSLLRFYSLYPEFLIGGSLARRRHPNASAGTGEVIDLG